MSSLTEKIERMWSLPLWANDAPLRVVNSYDQLKYSILADIQTQEQWLHDAVKSLYVMAEFESAAPYDEPAAVERARTLLARLGITGPISNQQEL